MTFCVEALPLGNAIEGAVPPRGGLVVRSAASPASTMPSIQTTRSNNPPVTTRAPVSTGRPVTTEATNSANNGQMGASTSDPRTHITAKAGRMSQASTSPGYDSLQVIRAAAVAPVFDIQRDTIAKPHPFDVLFHPGGYFLGASSPGNDVPGSTPPSSGQGTSRPSALPSFTMRTMAMATARSRQVTLPSYAVYIWDSLSQTLQRRPSHIFAARRSPTRTLLERLRARLVSTQLRKS